MLKKDELTVPTSCLNKAKEHQWVFVLIETDLDAPDTIRDWVARRLKRGKNKPGDRKIVDALATAVAMEVAQGVIPSSL